MLTSLTVSEFRGLKRLTFGALSRVNLLVGRNDAGMTSLLEAIEILLGGGRPAVLFQSLLRRREILTLGPDESAARPAGEYEVRHLFHGRRLAVGQTFAIAGASAQPLMVRVTVVPTPMLVSDARLAATAPEDAPALGLRFEESAPGNKVLLPLTANGGLFLDASTRGGLLLSPGVPFLESKGVEPAVLSRLWDAIVGNRGEERVTEALRIIEPATERITVTRGGGERSATLTFVHLKGLAERVPIGSLGEGLRRLLLVAIHLARATGGALLIDEIDTGLHYSSLEQLWRLVIVTARQLNVQVFATTHSGDCIAALARLYADEPEVAQDVSLHRIERNREETVRYTAEQIESAARGYVEMRG